MSDTGNSTGANAEGGAPANREASSGAYDWNDALSAPAKRAARKAPKGTASGRGGGPKRRGPGLIGWAIIATCLVIFAAGAMLGWMGWSFQVEAQRRNAEDLGLVPVSRDFAPGQDKAADVLFRVAGSRHLADRLMPDLAAAWMRARGYTGVARAEDGPVITLSGAKDGKSVRVLVVRGSAAGAFEAMTQRRVDAVISPRRILTAEADKLSAQGDMGGPGSEKVIGLGATVVLVNRANPVDSISTETLTRILSGEVTDWGEVFKDGNGAISVKLEGLGGDLADSPAGRLLGDKEAPENVKLLPDSRAVADAVARDGAAIGLARREDAGGGAKALTLNERNARQVGPDDLSIATEAYPFAERIHLYVPSAQRDAQDFAAFVLSPAGQDIVARVGLTPQKLEAVAPVVPPDAPQDYARFARDARRMNFDIRFDLGSNKVDSKGVEDVKRLAAWMQRNSVDNRRLALLGFADNVGARATNVGLAQSRAETVGILLERSGITPGIIRSYGDAMPVSANAEERGRIRNRRVEVWVCAPPACPLVDLVTQATTAPRAVPLGVRLGPQPKTPEGVEPPKG